MTETDEIHAVTIEHHDERVWQLPRAVRALGHRDFSIFWVGQIISNCGTWMQGLALGWLLFEITGSKLQLGALGMASALPVLFLSLPLGVIADRFDKRKITVITQSLAMLQALVLAGLTLSGRIEVWHVYTLAVFLGCVSAIDIPARQSMVIELVGKEDLLNAVSLNSAVFNVTRIIGPAVAGAIVAYYDTGICFLINGLSYIAVIISLLIIRPKSLGVCYNGESMLAQICEGLHHVRREPLVLNLLFLTAVASIFAMQYQTQMPAFAVEVYKVGAKGQGMLMSAAGLGALSAAAAVAAFGHRYRQGTIITFGSLLAPVGLMAFALAPNFLIALVCLVVTGFGVMTFFAVSNSLIQTSSPDGLRGRIMSARTFVFMGLAPFGAMQIGVCAQYFGVREAVLIGGAMFFLTSLYVALRSGIVRQAA